MMRRLIGMAFAAAITVVTPRDAEACTCTSWPSLEETTTEADVAVVGRVTSQAEAYLDIEVLSSLKGSKEGRIIRAWDGLHWSSCSLDLGAYSPGTILLVALEPNKKEYAEVQALLGLDIDVSDFLLGGCGDYDRTFATKEEALQFVARMKR